MSASAVQNLTATLGYVPAGTAGLTADGLGAYFAFDAPSSGFIGTYQYSTDGGVTWNTLPLTSPPGPHMTALRVGYDAAYFTHVRLEDGAGDGADTGVQPVSQNVGDVQNVTVVPRDGGADLSFTPPASTFGAPITGYQAQIPGTGPSFPGMPPQPQTVALTIVGGAGTTDSPYQASLSGLTNDTSVVIKIAAVTIFGEAWSDLTAHTVTPTASAGALGTGTGSSGGGSGSAGGGSVTPPPVPAVPYGPSTLTTTAIEVTPRNRASIVEVQNLGPGLVAVHHTSQASVSGRVGIQLAVGERYTALRAAGSSVTAGNQVWVAADSAGAVVVSIEA